MEWTVLLLILLTIENFVLSPTTQVCSDPECKYNWKYYEFPDLSETKGLCGQECHTRTRVCDPCGIVSAEKATEINELISHVNSIKTLCNVYNEVIIGVALLNRMDLNFRSKEENAKTFATNLRKQWDIGNGTCNNDVVIFFSRIDRQIYTSIGSDAHNILTSSCIQNIYEDARDTYLKLDQFGEGIKHMIIEYKKVFSVGKCEDIDSSSSLIVGLVTGVVLLIMLLCCLVGSCRKNCGSGETTGSGGGFWGGGGDGGGGGGGGGDGGGGGGC